MLNRKNAVKIGKKETRRDGKLQPLEAWKEDATVSMLAVKFDQRGSTSLPRTQKGNLATFNYMRCRDNRDPYQNKGREHLATLLQRTQTKSIHHNANAATLAGQAILAVNGRPLTHSEGSLPVEMPKHILPNHNTFCNVLGSATPYHVTGIPFISTTCGSVTRRLTTNTLEALTTASTAAAATISSSPLCTA